MEILVRDAHQEKGQTENDNVSTHDKLEVVLSVTRVVLLVYYNCHSSDTFSIPLWEGFERSLYGNTPAYPLLFVPRHTIIPL